VCDINNTPVREDQLREKKEPNMPELHCRLAPLAPSPFKVGAVTVGAGVRHSWNSARHTT